MARMLGASAAAMLWSLSVCGGCGEPRVGQSRAALGAAHTLVVDFTGATISAGASDDAIAGISSLGAAIVPPFDASIVAPAVAPAAVVAVLLDRVRTLYLPFDVDVVDAAPSSGDYARVLVGGTTAALTPPAPAGSAGIAALDCADADARSLGFAFSDEASPQFGGPVALAATIAHEAGHGYGLEHVQNPSDPMYSVGVPTQTLADLFAYAFSSGAYSPFVAGGGSQPERCGRVDPLDDHALLVAALGPRAPSSQAPSIHLDFPPPIASAPTSLPLRVSASDDVGVRRVEIYRDLTLIAALTAPPYAITLTLPASPRTRITVEAVDDDAQRASTSLELAVDPTAAAPCDDTTPCSDGGICIQHGCVAASPVDAGSDAGSETQGHTGCALAPGRAVSERNALSVLVVLLFWVRGRRGPRDHRSAERASPSAMA